LEGTYEKAGDRELKREGFSSIFQPGVAQDFYKDKTIRFIVGQAAGGGYDTRDQLRFGRRERKDRQWSIVVSPKIKENLQFLSQAK